MYYIHAVISYDHWTFELDYFDEKIEGLMKDIFDEDHISIYSVVKGELISGILMSNKEDLLDLLYHKEVRYELSGDAEMLFSIEQLKKAIQ